MFLLFPRDFPFFRQILPLHVLENTDVQTIRIKQRNNVEVPFINCGKTRLKYDLQIRFSPYEIVHQVLIELFMHVHILRHGDRKNEAFTPAFSLRSADVAETIKTR